MRLPLTTRLWVGLSLLALLSCETRPAGVSVLLVTIDTLRADATSTYGDDRANTPVLTALASRGTRFTRAFSASSSTAPSHASIFTGRYPSWHTVGNFNGQYKLDPAAVTLAERFRDHGYRTGAVVSNAVLRSGLGLDQGFDHYDDELVDLERNRPIPERRADRSVDAAVRWIEDQGGNPFFLWLHLQDPHGPYDPPDSAACDGGPTSEGPELPVGEDQSGYRAIPRYQVVDDERLFGEYVARYACEIEFQDRELGRLLDYLDAEGLAQRTVVAVTSDHGEALGEDDFYFVHSQSIGLDQVSVPLVLAGPGIPAGVEVDVPVSNIGIYPTVLQGVGLPIPETTAVYSLLAVVDVDPGQAPGVFVESLSQVGMAIGNDFVRRDRYPPAHTALWEGGNPNTGGYWKPLGSSRVAISPEAGPSDAEDEDLFLALDRFEALAQVAQTGIQRRRAEVEVSPEQAEMLRALGYAD